MARHVNHSQGGILRCRPPTYLTPGFRQVSPVCRQIQPAALEDIHGERGQEKGAQCSRLDWATQRPQCQVKASRLTSVVESVLTLPRVHCNCFPKPVLRSLSQSSQLTKHRKRKSRFFSDLKIIDKGSSMMKDWKEAKRQTCN